MRFHRFPAVLQYTLGAGTLALFASLVLATAPTPITPPPRAVAAMSPPPVTRQRSGGLQAASRASALGLRELAPALQSGGQPPHSKALRAEPSATMDSTIANGKLPIQNPKLVESYGKLPLSFEINQGQTDPQVKFLSRGPGYTLFLTGSEAVLSLPQPSAVSAQLSALGTSKSETGNWKFETGNWPIWNLQSEISNRQSLLPHPTDRGPRPKDASLAPSIDNLQSSIDNASNKAPAVLRMTLVGANANAKVTGMDPLPGKSNYFLGNDPKKWRTNVANYAKVRYADVYPGVDLVYYGNQGQLEYDFVVAPGANPKAIKLAVAAMSPSPVGGETPPLQIDASGDLVIATDAGEVRFRKPLVYQPSPESRAPNPGSFNRQSSIDNRQFLDGHYTLVANNQVRFEVPEYDPTLPLIIDPVLRYSALFARVSGWNVDEGAQVPVAVDADGYVYLTEGVDVSDFPTTPGAFEGPCRLESLGGPCFAATVVKLNPDASALVYSAILGPASASGIAVDASGSAYLAGYVSSVDFPTTPGAFQPSCAVSSGTYPSCHDVFVTKLSPDGSALVYSTFLGGGGLDTAVGVAVDASGNAYVGGNTESTSFPTTPGALQASCALQEGWQPCNDVFVSKLSPDGSALVYSTYLGGSDPDTATAFAVDAEGNAHLTGISWAGYETEWGCDPQSPWCPPGCDPGGDPGCIGNFYFYVPLDAHFPTTLGALKETCSGFCGFLAKISGDGSEYVYSTYLGNKGARALAVDPNGNAYATGSSLSPERGAYREMDPGASVWKLNPAGSALVYQTSLQEVREASAIAVDTAGNAYVVGTTYSDQFPTVNPIQPSLRGPRYCDGYVYRCPDAFVTKLNAEGTAALFSTYLGGEARDYGSSVAIDGSGNIYLTGGTNSYDFPTTPGSISMAPAGGRYVFVAKIAPEDAPGVAATPVALRLPSVLDPYAPGPPKVTVRNVGTAPLTITEFAVAGGFAASSVDCLGTFSPGAACTIYVAYAGDAPFAEELTGTLSITDNASDSPQIVTLSGDRPHGPNPTLSAGHLEFQEDVGVASPPQMLTLGNSAVINNDPLEIYGITVTGEFSETNNCPLAPNLLAAGESCTISIVFTPTSMGDRVGELRIANDSPVNWNLPVGLAGIGLQARVSLPSQTLSFAGQPVGTTSTAKKIDLRNTGNAPLSVSAVTVSGDFGLKETPYCVVNGPVSPGNYCTIKVTFTPTAPGSAAGAITITDNAPDSPQVVTLSGTGVGPLATLSGSTLSFAGQIMGTTSAAQGVTLSNSGNAPLTINSITISGAYAESNDCVSPLAAGASCTINITFTPTVGGGQSGTLTTIDNAFGSPHTVALSGVGQDFSLGAFNTARSVSPGMTARFNLLLRPQGGFDQTVTLTCSGAPAGATCSVRPSSVGLNGADNVSVTLEVVTTAPAASAPRHEGWRMTPPPRAWPLATTLALLGVLALLAGVILRRAASSARLRLLPVLGACLLLVALVWAACGGGGGLYVRSGGTPAGTYTLTITATASDLSHSTTVELTVR